MRRASTKSGRPGCATCLVGQILHTVVELIVEALNLWLNGQKMRRDAVPLVSQNVQQHVAGEEHVREFIDNLKLQGLLFLENRLVEKSNTFDGLCEFVRVFRFFVS